LPARFPYERDVQHESVIRIAAAGDVHASELTRERTEEAFTRVQEEADIVLLAGDLTTHGEPEEAAVLADACRGSSIPICAVLGNHDLHAGKGDEVAAILREVDVNVLERETAIYELNGLEVGIVGTKGFVGGFPGSALPDFGEPLLRELYAETSAEADAIASGLQEVGFCELRIVLLHYAPTSDTLHGEPEGIWTFLGTDRLAAPIVEHEPDLVLHGHAHAGTFEGKVGEVPVFNVSVPVMRRDFWVFEVTAAERRASAIH
jgi:Icc-related predicted phosphoesterase